jgi:hypothetical protein
MKRWPPISPFLLALVPVATFYERYFGSYPLADLLSTGGALLALSGAIFLLAWLLLRRAHAAAILAWACLAVFFAYYPVLEALWPGPASPTPPAHAGALALLLAAVAWIGRRLRRSTGQLENPNRILTIMSLGMLLVPAVQLAQRHADPAETGGSARHAEAALPIASRRPHPLPNVYLIVLDRYADRDTLSRRFDLDNTAFYQALRDRGFYVAEHSRSNYLKTAQSLASLLNFEFLDGLTDELGREHSDWHPLYERIRNHAVARFLRSQGYRYVHAGSWWWPTRDNPHADVNVNPYRLPPEVLDTARRSPLYPVAAWLQLPLFDMRMQQWLRIRHQLGELRRMAATTEPTFFFAHMLVPHDPHIFDEDGSFVTWEKDFRGGEEDSYRRQVLYMNREIGTLIDHILAVSATPPVIVLMSEEGTFPVRYRDDVLHFDWRHATPAELREKTGILHAFYLPCGRADELHSALSPVNTFRVIFNACFGADLQQLPDLVFAHTVEHRPYDFFDVTQTLGAMSEPHLDESPLDPAVPRRAEEVTLLLRAVVVVAADGAARVRRQHGAAGQALRGAVEMTVEDGNEVDRHKARQHLVSIERPIANPVAQRKMREQDGGLSRIEPRETRVQPAQR